MGSKVSNRHVMWVVVILVAVIMGVGVVVIQKVEFQPDVALWLAGSIFALVLSLLDFAKQIALKQLTKD